MDFLGFLKEDWQKIPQNLRYFVISGTILLVIDWTSYHWSKGVNYTYLGKNYHQFFFNLGVSLILLGFLLIIAKQIFVVVNLQRFRYRYSLKNLNITYGLIWFNGKLYLFDKKKKTASHITPAETASDLSFWGVGVPYPGSFEEAQVHGLEVGDPVNIKVKDYNLAGPINTRR